MAIGYHLFTDKFLAKTPLLLALLCLAYDETLSFPRRRVELYEDAINALLKKWDSSRLIHRDDGYQNLSQGRKIQLLCALARQSFDKGSIFFDEKFAINIINNFYQELPPEDRLSDFEASNVLRAMECQHGLIVERAHNIYSFSHLTIHEYFVARSYVDSLKENELYLFAKEHAIDDQWREVLFMIASIVNDGEKVILALQEVIKSLVEACPVFKVFWNDLIKTKTDQTPKLPKKSGVNDVFYSAVIDLLLSITANIDVLNVNGVDSNLSRMATAAANNNRYIFDKHFSGNEEAQRKFIQFWRLMLMLTECLHLVKMNNRAEVTRNLYSSLMSY